MLVHLGIKRIFGHINSRYIYPNIYFLRKSYHTNTGYVNTFGVGSDFIKIYESSTHDDVCIVKKIYLNTINLL